MSMETPAPTPWCAAYAAPKPEAATIPREEVLVMLKERRPGKDFVLVDLRRNDHEVRPSNIALYPSLPTIYRMFKEAGVRKVIWYCGRATSWLADLIASEGDTSMQSLALLEGIRGWANAGGEYVEWMDGYDAAVWFKSG
ncbi:arsenical-resistance protein 2 [Diplogelasinospora grovesii]|uniref:Arsenical-resistance protein 2 n=1 Tax=Diplogelasinospora grovesii TaxID=303347 RepID=A0AAN6MUW3_9PEZI|nr:arsenical-resistance protein 2 [Diplogelasinospora grovesii]